MTIRGSSGPELPAVDSPVACAIVEPMPDDPVCSDAGGAAVSTWSAVSVARCWEPGPPSPLLFAPSLPAPPVSFPSSSLLGFEGVAIEVGAVAAANSAASLPAWPCSSSFFVFCEPRTLIGERWRAAWSVFLSPPVVGKASVYWAAAELLGGTTASSAADAEAGIAKRAAIATVDSESWALRGFIRSVRRADSSVAGGGLSGAHS